MELHSLTPANGSNKSKKVRIGRGEGTGKGGTATRGHKGAKSRSGYSKKIGFEGGQMPLQRRVPKFGFRNPNTKVYSAINLDTLQNLSEKLGVTEITREDFTNNGLAAKKDLVKVLGRGELKAKLKVTADAFSASAKEAIEKAGGEAVTL